MFLNKVCVSVNFYNTESTSFYVVSATYSFKVWVGGTSNFYEETKNQIACGVVDGFSSHLG